MGSTNHHARLDASELSQLWRGYMKDSLAVCTTSYFLRVVEDPDIRPVIEQALALAQSHISKLTAIFQADDRPVPFGFSEEQDVDINAPRLYSDVFMLNNVKQGAQMGMESYARSKTLCTREDVRNYFSECIQEDDRLHNQAVNVLLSKGLYVRAPYMETPSQVEFVTKQSFLSGWFGKQRPLLSMEIANLYSNHQRNTLGSQLLTGFCQVAQSEKVQQYFDRGKNIASKHAKAFTSTLQKEDLPASVIWDEPVTDTTVSPFSDKLMLFQVIAMNAIGIGYYGTSAASTLRHDLVTLYPRLIAEVATYTEDGVNLMIDNGWLEEPPRMIDHDQLGQDKR